MNYQNLEPWQKKTFEIMSAQSVNLASEVLGRRADGKAVSEEEAMKVVRSFFRLLLAARNDPELQKLYAESRSDATPPEDIAL